MQDLVYFYIFKLNNFNFSISSGRYWEMRLYSNFLRYYTQLPIKWKALLSAFFTFFMSNSSPVRKMWQLSTTGKGHFCDM